MIRPLLLSAAAAAALQSGTHAQTPPNTLADAEREAGWVLLFDGVSMVGWRGFRGEAIPAGWAAQNGTITRIGAGGDIITALQFENFELRLEWKVEAAGNSGIFFRVSEEATQIFESGPEMQVLDDEGHPDGQSDLTSAGSNFGLHPAPRGIVSPAGAWNAVRLVVDGPHVEHWLNGVRVVTYELWSEDWERRVADSKFVRWSLYGRARRGHIGLQNHGDWVAYRNVKIRPLP